MSPTNNALMGGYQPGSSYCEMTAQNRVGDAGMAALMARLQNLSIEELQTRAGRVDREFYNLGITFTVYSEADAIDRVLPFDVVPRVLTAAEWTVLEAGVVQRVAAINAFLTDIYSDRKILTDGVLPSDLVLQNKNYRSAAEGVAVPHNAYVNICGIDLIRDADGIFRVLEDNARTPSGVSYVIENRHMMLRVFADLFGDTGVRPVDDYGMQLHRAMTELVPPERVDPSVVLLSPGIYNSAFFEHVFLAREMGVALVEGRDLFVAEDDRVYMNTIGGAERVHAIYRRVDDDFLDPEVFREDSLLGVPGLVRSWRAGKVAIANSIGTGVADDKAIYAYMPRIIRYYLDQDAILPNVETHLCREAEGLQYTLDNLADLVVKPVGESGGYGMLIGPKSTSEEIEDFRAKLKADPANYISQPTIDLSVSPTVTEDGLRPRHVDLRPFAITGESTWVLPGGLTRVALKEGSLVVNSSQGGGSKDTWVLNQ
ncbi:MAG: circularly permuted type 2 ATP-grasp protein [Pseudomonadota bacterium]